MMRFRKVALVLFTVTVATVLSGCVKSTTFDPYAAPDKNELDRLQKTINDRPDLERAQQQLADLDTQIRNIINAHSPATQIPPSTPAASTTCGDPFAHNIGQSSGIEKIYARPAPTRGNWSVIADDLEPVLTTAGFHVNTPSGVTPPAGSFSYIRDDGATIELNNSPAVLVYSYSTGCHLPAAWRTSPPPPDQRPLNDPGVHYPYLYGSPGGRTAPAT